MTEQIPKAKKKDDTHLLSPHPHSNKNQATPTHPNAPIISNKNTMGMELIVIVRRKL